MKKLRAKLLTRLCIYVSLRNKIINKYIDWMTTFPVSILCLCSVYATLFVPTSLRAHTQFVGADKTDNFIHKYFYHRLASIFNTCT